MKMSSLDNSTVEGRLVPPDEQNGDSNDSPFDASFTISLKSRSAESKDVCEEVLDNKMAALELNDVVNNKTCNAGDGSDSGVDIAVSLNIGLQRALSSNSGGYASSCGGLDEIQNGGNVSCDSSMISYSSDVCENKATNVILNPNSNNDGTSENGSESSSVAGGPTLRKSSIIKKKVAVSEPVSNKIPRKNCDPSTPPSGQLNSNRARSRAGSVNRSIPTPKASSTNSVIQSRERARSKEKSMTPPSSSKCTTPPARSTPIRRPPKPDTLPNSLISASPSIQRLVGVRTPSVTRARTPGSTPTDDGRWPSVGGRGITMPPKRAGSAAPDVCAIKSRVNMLALDVKMSSPVLDKYATLPRRRKEKSVEDLPSRGSRSSSVNRDIKMTSSTITPPRKYVSATGTPSRESTPSKLLPPFPKSRKPTPKTKIYHETSVQTAITCQDVENAFAGAAKNVRVDAVETFAKGTQSDIRDKEIEALKEQLQRLSESKENLQTKLNERTQMLVNMEQQLNREHEEKLQAQRELHLNTERVIGMLELARGTPTDDGACDSLLMLESQIQMSGHELEEKQEEINKLRRICRNLQNEMERSMNTQKFLLQEKANIEKESYELQDFLQNEKTAMYDALKEAESENQECKKKLEEKENEIKVLDDQCRHLVRVSEQRRQEFKGMQSKYNALETRSKELIVQQSTAVSGASMALSGLNSRLDSLVEQLICSYNISEQDLEDVVFHNEAYTNSGSSDEGSPEYETASIIKSSNDQNDGSLSPQRNQSFIAAVISAIKSATSSSKKHLRVKNKSSIFDNGDESDSTEMLDSETEPCLMMDNVLEDVTMPDSHSHNMVSSSGMMISQIEIPSDIMHGDESFHNLSQAIADCQQIEMQMNSIAAARKVALLRTQSVRSNSEDMSAHDSIAEIPSISEYCSAQALVDQAIEVDNLVTKLLKVLRLIQMDNDKCIQQLICDKNKLQLNKEEMLEKMKEWEDMNIKLREQLMDASQELLLKGNDLSNSKADLQRHRNEIDRLNYDICNLSTLCSQSRQPSQQNQFNKIISKNDLLGSIRKWQEHGQLAEAELVCQIIRACNEIPLLREKLHCTMRSSQSYLHLPPSWQENAILETKRQYEAIDRALEVLSNHDDLVQQFPALAELQQDLQETNFRSATTIPMFTAFLKAAAAAAIGSDNVHSVITEDEVNANEPSTTLHLNCDNAGNQTQINSPV